MLRPLTADGTIDEDVPEATVWFEDADGDGFGSDATVTACDPPAGYAGYAGDCDNLDGSVFPGAADPGGDGIDQDCSGADAPEAVVCARGGCAAVRGSGAALPLLLVGFALTASRRRAVGERARKPVIFLT